MSSPNVITVLNQISQEFPAFKVRPKAGSALMRAIDIVLKILTFGQMRAFMTGFVTTLGTTVYVPTSWDKLLSTSQCITLRHERVHMRQARAYGQLLFSFLYLFCWFPIWRASWRTRFEQEAYEESIRALLEYGEDPSNIVFRTRTIQHFASAQYLYMWSDEEAVAAWFDAAVRRIKAEPKK